MRRFTFLLLGAVQVTLIVALTAPLVALPAIQRDLGLTRAELAMVSSAYGLGFAGLLLLGGRVADLLGHRRVFLAGLALFTAATAGVALAPGLAVLRAARFVQGIAAAGIAPAALALVRSVFPEPARRARALAVWGGPSALGATLGTLLSGVVTTWMSWRSTTPGSSPRAHSPSWPRTPGRPRSR